MDVFPTNPAAPPFVCVDVVVPSTIFLSDVFALLMDKNVLHAEKRIIGEMFAVYQSLIIKPIKGVAVESILNLQKGNKTERSIFIALRLVIKPKTTLKHQFQISCQVTKSDTQAFLEVEVVSDHCKKPLSCKVDTGAERNVIYLSTYKSLFPNSSCNSGGIPTSLAPSSTIITAFGGHAVGHYGTCVLKLTHGDSWRLM